MNYKIEVKNKEQADEAQELFFDLGYEKGACSTGSYPAVIIAVIKSNFQKTPYSSRALSLKHEAHKKYREITLPELRALVSLHKKPINMDKVLNEVRSDALGLLKEKEYLRRNAGGTYSYVGTVHPDHVHDLLIEIPDGADVATSAESIYFWNTKNNTTYVDGEGWVKSDGENFCTLDEYLIETDYRVIWKRHTQPEELPFVDDEPSFEKHVKTMKSLMLPCVPKPETGNQSYKVLKDILEGDLPEFEMKTEQVKHSAWDTQVGGNHYKSLPIQPAQFAMANKLDYCQSNVIKYIVRHESKNGKQDLEKAKHYIDLLIEHYYS